MGMEFSISKEGIFVSQRKHTLDFPKKTRFLGCKPTKTPIDPTCKLWLLKESKCTSKEHY